MKRTIMLSLLLALVCLAKGQSPVSWQYSATKTGPGQYEVRLKAIIQEGWHLFAQDQPEDAIAVPTAIKFTGNPVITLAGKPKEQGEKQHFKDSDLGISARQYKRICFDPRGSSIPAGISCDCLVGSLQGSVSTLPLSLKLT